MVLTDENTREFIISQYEETIEERGGQALENKDKILEEVYLAVEDEETSWDDLYELADRHSDEWGMELMQVRRMASSMEDGDLVKTADDAADADNISAGKKQALKMQIKAQPGKENLVYTDEAISNGDRRKLVDDVYRDERKLAFIISNQESWEGRISLQLSRNRERFNLSRIYSTTGESAEIKVQHFGENKGGNKGTVQIEKHSHGFYQYKFVSDDDREYIVLSDDKLDPQRCRIQGTKVSISDYKTLGESRKIPVDQEVIFMHSMEPAIEPLSGTELDGVREGIDHDYLAKHVFGEFRHPEWYEKMMFAVLAVKNDNGYPSHLMQMAEPGTAKSTILESISDIMAESHKPFTGTTSTVKGLVPSFSENPPDEGYLMRCDRVAPIDEKFNLLSNTVQNSNSRMQDAFRPMLDLLEHSDREFSSGNGSISGRCEATVIAMGNPSYGFNSIYDALENDKIDEAYLSRFLLYDQLDSHIDFINERKSKFSSGDDQQYMPERSDEFVSLMDTMRMTQVDGVEHEKVQAIKEELMDVVPSVFRTTFRARYEHHIQNLVCGMAKHRYLVGDKDESLKPQPEDYEMAKEIIETLVSSWGDIDKTDLSYRARTNALTHAQRRVFEAINDDPGVRDVDLFNRVDVEGMSRVMSDLNTQNLIEIKRHGDEDRKHYYPYWTDVAQEIREEREE